MKVLKLATVSIVAVVSALLLVMAVQGGSAQSGRYLEFTGPGSGYVEVAHDPALNPTEEITIDLWVYLDSITATGTDDGEDCPGFVGKGYETAYWFGIDCDSQRLAFYGQGTSSFAEGSGDLPLGEWAHVAVTYDGTNVRFYINGALDATVAVGGPLTTNTEPLRIGNDVDWDQSPMGMIDDVRIWDVAASDEEIATLMNTKIDEPMPGLVGAWNFDGSPEADVGGWGGTLVDDVQISGEPEPTPVMRLWGDADCNDSTNPIDALVLLRHDGGLSVSQQPGCPLIGDPVLVTD